MVSVEEKAYKDMSGMDQEGERQANQCKRRNPGMTVSKVGSIQYSAMNLGDTCLLPRWHPAYSWHEPDPGSCVERGNSSRDVKRKPYKCGT